MINIAGLAMGVAVAIFLFLFIDYVLGFDSHFNNSDRLCRVVRQVKTPTGQQYSSCNYFPLSMALRNDFSELPAVIQTYKPDDEVVWIDKQRFDLGQAMFVEPDFFELMQPQWIIEDRTRGADPTGVILTESLSKKYFGCINTVGRRLTLGDSLELAVTCIVADTPISPKKVELIL